METTLLIHKIAASLFLLFYLIKAVYVYLGKEKLQRISSILKVPEMVISFTFLATGIYMLVKLGHPPVYLMVKIALILLVIPVAVIGVRRNSKILLTSTALILIYLFGMSETRSLTFQKPKAPEIALDINADNYALVKEGSIIYFNKCLRCHGKNGDKGAYDSSPLSQSILDEPSFYSLLAEGKGLMPSYKDQFDQGEKKALFEFLQTLKSSKASTNP